MRRSFVFIFILFSGCIEMSDHKIIIDYLAREPLDLGYPSKFEGLYIFLDCKSKNEKKIIHPRYLKAKYIQNRYKFKYVSYLRKVFNNEIQIENSDDCFRLDKTITDNYNRMNFDSFLLLYCYNENNKLRLKEYLTENENYSILYYLFLNGYYTFWDDYIGIYSIMRID